MLLVTSVSDKGILQLIAPPGFVTALLLLKEQLVIFGADSKPPAGPLELLLTYLPVIFIILISIVLWPN